MRTESKKWAAPGPVPGLATQAPAGIECGDELELLSMMLSHDLRSPLATIATLAQIVEERCAGTMAPQTRQLLHSIGRICATTMVTVEDLAHYCRVARGPVDPVGVDMAKLVAAAWEEVGPGAHVRLELGCLPWAFGDAALLKRVWVNLLSNAVKYSGQRVAPRVEVSGESTASEVTFCVRDNGVGFDMALSGRLFRACQRLHASDDFPGTGMGLAIVARIVARHGGRVCAEGRPGRGASFWFCLPAGGRAPAAGTPGPPAIKRDVRELKIDSKD